LPINFEDNHPLEGRFASVAKIPFVIAISFLAMVIHGHVEANGFEGKVSRFLRAVT
jgi:hypothetical protein